jgi:serine/threonine-protein kinase HipA
VRLAPAYDVVPLTHVPGIDGRMAMAVGGLYVHAAITRADIVRELASWRFRRAESVVDETLARVLDAAEREVPLPEAAPSIQEDVIRIARNLLSGEAAGRMH